MSSEVQRLPKPQLRGLLHSAIKVNLGVAVALSALGAIAVKMFIGEPRKARYAEFYKHYDPHASFERMRKAGHMSSADP